MEFHNEYKNSLEYNFPPYRLGAPTSPQTANQIEQMGFLLNQGMQNIEIGAIDPQIFEQIPKQHFEELRRLSKLTNANISVHAPIVDPAGFGQEAWNEYSRMQTENQIKSFLEKAYVLDDKGNVPINIHVTGGMTSNIWQKEGLQYPEGAEKTGKKAMMVVDQETGRVVPLQHELKTRIYGEEIYTPERNLNVLNETHKDEETLKLFGEQKKRDELAKEIQSLKQTNDTAERAIEQEKATGAVILTPEQRLSYHKINNEVERYAEYAQELDNRIATGVNEMYGRFAKFANQEEKNKFMNSDLYKNFQQIQDVYKERHNEMKEAREQAIKISDEHERVKFLLNKGQEIEKKYNNIANESNLLTTLSRFPTPQQFVPVDEFAAEKTAQTIANSAFYAYDKFKDKAPVIVLENVYPEQALSRADTLRKTIELCREEFTKQLVQRKNMDSNEAREVAKKLIGATWDVGHINLLRKSGYSKEDIVKEAEKIGPYVKHIHLTDNFGFSDSHLALGMGDVPIKEQIAAIEKGGGSGRAIIESGAFVQQFKTSPFPPSLSYMNSPLFRYEVDQPRYWQSVTPSYFDYSIGYGEFLPSGYFQRYGPPGFSNLPRELGGQGPQERGSRLSGTPME